VKVTLISCFIKFCRVLFALYGKTEFGYAYLGFLRLLQDT